MVGAQRTLVKINLCEGMMRMVEPVWEMGKPMSFPMMMSSMPL